MITNEQIRSIVDSDIKLLKIYDNDLQGEYSWWVINSFAPASKGEESIRYHTVVGYEITDFINNNHTIQRDSEFIRRLVDLVDNSKQITCEFHDLIRWKLYVR